MDEGEAAWLARHQRRRCRLIAGAHACVRAGLEREAVELFLQARESERILLGSVIRPADANPCPGTNR